MKNFCLFVEEQYGKKSCILRLASVFTSDLWTDRTHRTQCLCLQNKSNSEVSSYKNPSLKKCRFIHHHWQSNRSSNWRKTLIFVWEISQCRHKEWRRQVLTVKQNYDSDWNWLTVKNAKQKIVVSCEIAVMLWSGQY